ncbi:hypothetical protein FQA39_LY09502 [Lamprigera yunnana]|nr:hypothetical protein FQA39_LY09502 [Lamprigera yunnana]
MISRNLQNSISSNELETVPKDINDDIFMQPTQVIEPIKTVPKVDIVQAMGVLEPVVKEKEQCTLKNMQTNNDIYLLPTQVTDMNDDIFMQPTQVIEQIETEQKVTKVDVKSIGDLESVVEVKDQCSLKKMQTNNDIYSIPTQVTDMNDDIFMQPTQVIEQIETEQKVTKVDVQAIRVLESVVEVKGQCSLKMQTDKDIFLHPTQVAEFDDVYMQSTQPLSTNVQQSETFLQPTQPLIATRENYIFDKPKTVLSKSKVANQELNEMYLQPTQQLVATKPTTTDSEDCIENKLEALFASQNATATTNVESQLEVTFVSQNISLNVDVSDRPLNPLLNEFNSETNTLEDSTDFISNSSIDGNTTQSFEEKSLPSETKLEQHLKNLSKNVQQIETDIQLSTTKDGVVKEPETASSKVADSQEEIENKLQRMFASQDSLQAPQTNLKKQLRNVSVNDEKNINKHALKRNSPESKNRNKKLRSTKIIEEDKDQEKSTVQLDDVHSLKEEADTEVKHASPRLRKSMRNVKTTSAKEKRNQSLQKLTKRNKVTKSEDNHLKTTIPSDDSKAVKQHEEISDTKGSSTSMEEYIKISSANGEKSKNKQKLKDHSTSKNSIDQKLLINRASSSDEDSTKFDVTKEVDTLEIKDVSVERQTRGKAKGTHTVDKNTKTKTNEDVSDRINVNVLDSAISTRPKRNTKLPAKLRTENEPIPEKVDAKLKEDHFEINTSKLNPDTHNKVKSVKSNTKVINTPSSKRSHNGGSKIEELDSSNSEDSFSSKSLKRHNKRDTCLDMASSPSKKLKQSILQTDKSADLTSLISTPERSRRKLKPKVVFTMLDSPELESIIRNLGGTIVDSIESCTVLVTGSLKRSLKLLSAVGLGKPICSPNWINECKKANQFLDPWHFILEDKEAESRWKLSLKESLKRSKTQKLLEGYIVYVMVTTAVDVLKAAIESCGGKCVTKATGKNSNEELIIIANPENKTKYSRFLKKKPPTQVLLPEAIFDGVLRQELHFEQHSVI